MKRSSVSMMSSGSSGDVCLDKDMKVSVISGHANQVTHAYFFPWFATLWEVVSQSDRAWKNGRSFAISDPMLLASSCTDIYRKSFPVPKAIQRYPSPGNRQLPEQQRLCQRFLLSRTCIQNSWHPLREAEF